MLRLVITLLPLIFMLIALILYNHIDDIIGTKQFHFDKPLKADNKENSIN